MTNNDILRRLRFILKLNDNDLLTIMELGSLVVEKSDVNAWLKREGSDGYREMKDKELASFLNGLITYKRGRHDGKEPVSETILTNNLILKKIKIALRLTSEDIVDVFKAIDKRITVSEIGAFLRKPSHAKYRDFNGQYMRNLLYGLQTKGLNESTKAS